MMKWAGPSILPTSITYLQRKAPSLSTTNNKKQIAVKISNIPDALKKQPQWVNWKRERDTKVPYQRGGKRKADSTDPATWSEFEDIHPTVGDGIGFVFSEGDEFCGIDLDDCVHGGKLQPWSDSQRCQLPDDFPDPKEIIAHCDSYTEISPSGTGVEDLSASATQLW